MALNRFLGWSITDLETEIRATQEQLDKTVTRVSAGDTDVSYALTRSMETKLEQLYAAARLLDPGKYPVASTTRNDRTYAVFPGRFNNGNPTL